MTPDEAPLILVTTAGKIGAEASRLLAERGAPVRVLVRHPEKVTALAQAGVDVCKGDLEVPSTIDAAMRGVTSVVLVSPAIPRQELNVVASAVRARVQHVVKITSKASADSPIARRRGQFEIEKGLIASGLGYTRSIRSRSRSKGRRCSTWDFRSGPGQCQRRRADGRGRL